MANHKSAKKAIRKTETRTLLRKSRSSKIKTFIKKVKLAISSGDHAAAMQQLSQAQSQIMKGVNKNILKLNTESR